MKQALARHGIPAGTELIMATSLEQWLGAFASAGLAATGRFHYFIAAFSLGAPFVVAS
jgi:polysaccharide pyruvyl transferase WcaK-like protein